MTTNSKYQYIASTTESWCSKSALEEQSKNRRASLYLYSLTGQKLATIVGTRVFSDREEALSVAFTAKRAAESGADLEAIVDFLNSRFEEE